MGSVRVAAFLAVLSLALLTPGPSVAQSRPPFTVLPDFAAGTDFSDAGAIAAGPDDSVHVVRGRSGARRLEVFSAGGQFVRTIAAFDPSNGARDIDVDRDGNVYTTGQRRIQKFDASGALVDDDWSGGATFSLATGGGQVAVSGDPLRDQRLRRMTPAGQLMSIQMTPPASGIAMDRFETVYVASIFGLFAISPAGDRRSIGQVAPPGRGADPDEFSYVNGASGPVVTPGGDLYAVDLAESRILRFDPNGDFISSCGQTRFKRQLEPRSLAAMSDGSLLVVDGSVIRHFGIGRDGDPDGCLDQYVTPTRLSIERSRVRGELRHRLRVRSRARVTATLRLYRLVRSSAGPVRAVRVKRTTRPLREGPNTVRIGRLKPGRYRITVDAADSYGNIAVRRFLEFSAARRSRRPADRAGLARAARRRS